MTIQQALRSLDRDGRNAAKRLSMNGYIFIRPVPDDGADSDPKPNVWEVVIVAKDGAEASFFVDGRMQVVKRVVDTTFDAEFVENVMFAEDWEIASREKLEVARSGGGRW